MAIYQMRLSAGDIMQLWVYDGNVYLCHRSNMVQARKESYIFRALMDGELKAVEDAWCVTLTQLPDEWRKAARIETDGAEITVMERETFLNRFYTGFARLPDGSHTRLEGEYASLMTAVRVLRAQVIRARILNGGAA